MNVDMDGCYFSTMRSSGGEKKRRKKCMKMEVGKKIKNSLIKTKYIVVKTDKEKEEDILGQVKGVSIQRTKNYKIVRNHNQLKGHLKGHIEELKQKSEAICREIKIFGSNNQVGKEEVRVELKLFQTCFMPVLIYGIEAWGDTKKEDKVTGKKTTRQSNRQENYQTK